MTFQHKPSGISRFMRLTALDWALLALLAVALAWLYHRASGQLNYTWQWHRTFTLLFTPPREGGLPYFFHGVLATIRISLWGMLLAFVLGALLGFARFSRHALWRVPATLYVLLVRNLPPLVFVFIFYYFVSTRLLPALGLSQLFAYRGEVSGWVDVLFGAPRLWENTLSGVICVGLLSAAYMAEVVRAGLASISHGQWEAAKSLGLKPWHQFRFVIMPQVLAAITPALAGQAISLVKDTSIVSLISIQELTFVGNEMATSSNQFFEIWLVVGAVYFALCWSISWLFSVIEARHMKHLQ
ncbi:hypothetical protein VST7929_01565 [Vibrio stylophorae]|uniref:ABC transmembrane type-1 domain-containing protein n=1 Tax=Vibrio stylophorae TaxID=659351 RepID=A0ABM8ZTQ9_9VIBR|nr:amino acid ABC transporter permease [Vibrio stylophorae]CAH0533692.1 hypothetical protein VST7929_01565 [Vibrio stylophorae]